MSTTTDTVVMPNSTNFNDLPNDVLDVIYRMKTEIEHREVMTELTNRVTRYEPITRQECGSWYEYNEYNDDVVTRTKLNRLRPSGGGWSWTVGTTTPWNTPEYPEIYNIWQYFENDERYLMYYSEELQIDQFLEDDEEFDEHLYETALTNWCWDEFDHNNDEDVRRLINIARVECKYATMI